MTSPSTRGIVLDTSCVRGTPRELLSELMRRGCTLHVSSLAIFEIFVHIAADETSEISQKLRARMRALSEISGRAVPYIAPTHVPLVDKLGGRVDLPGRLEYRPWLQALERQWLEVSAHEPLSAETKERMAETASYVEDTGADFVRTMRQIADRGELSSADRLIVDRLNQKHRGIVDLIRLPTRPTAAERFDAYTKIMELHGFRAYDRSLGRLAANTKNDAMDLNMLQHLADNLIVVTNDYRLIEEVDASGSMQAPWVRTVGELLQLRIPPGPPWGYRARIEAGRHRQRKRVELMERDQRALRLARNENAPK